MEKKRTAPIQTRIDYRTLCTLAENAPSEAFGDNYSISSILRFYLESFEESLIDKGYTRCESIEDAIARLETLGLSLGALHNESREARATRLAIQKERMKDLLDIKPKKPKPKDDTDDFVRLAEEAAKKLNV